MSQPGWAPFLAVAVVLTLAVLALARQSQHLLEEYDLDDGHSHDAGEPADPGPLAGPDRTVEAVPERIEGLSVVDDTTVPGSTLERAGTKPKDSREPEIQLTSGMLLANVAVTQGLVAGVVLVAAWYFSIPADAVGVTSAPASMGAPAVTLGVVFGVVLWLGNEAATAIADAVGAAYDEGVRRMLAPESTGGWLVLLGGVLPLIALSEELLFRAALIGVPAAGFPVSPWLLAAVSSVAFALGHGAQGRVGIAVTGGLGLVLAAGYVVSGSLLLVVVAHYVINAAEFLVHERFGIEDAPFWRAGMPGT